MRVPSSGERRRRRSSGPCAAPMTSAVRTRTPSLRTMPGTRSDAREEAAPRSDRGTRDPPAGPRASIRAHPAREDLDDPVPRRRHQAGRPGPAQAGLRPGAVPQHGRIQQLRHQLQHHLHPDRRGHPVRLRSRLGWHSSRHARLAAHHHLRPAHRGLDGGDRVGLPDGRWALLLGQQDEEQGLGLVDRMVQPHRPVRHRGWHQLGGRQLPERDLDHAHPGRSRHHLRQHHGRLRHRRQRHPDRRPGDDGRPDAHRADPQHRGHQCRRDPEPGQRLVAHRRRAGHRRLPVPPRAAERVGPDALRHPAAGHRWRLGQHLPAGGVAGRGHPGLQRQLRSGRQLPAGPGLLLLVAAGQLDLHRL